MKKADWKVTWSNGTVQYFCKSCYSKLTNKHKIEDVSKCNENINCEKCSEQIKNLTTS